MATLHGYPRGSLDRATDEQVGVWHDVDHGTGVADEIAHEHGAPFGGPEGCRG
jgi:hypothetical protein